MSSMTVFIIFVAAIPVIFLIMTEVLAEQKPYLDKNLAFECGYSGFPGQNRTQFGVKFFIFGLVYLILDLEIILIFPYAASGYENGIYGLILTLFFIVTITFGFVFELGKEALRIDSKQVN